MCTLQARTTSSSCLPWGGGGDKRLIWAICIMVQFGSLNTWHHVNGETNQLIKENQTYQQFFHCFILLSLFRLKERWREKRSWINYYTCANYKAMQALMRMTVPKSWQKLNSHWLSYFKYRQRKMKVQRAAKNHTMCKQKLPWILHRFKLD